MHLIAPLASGFSNAASGSALIRQRGTVTAATAYSDFEGNTTQTTHTLDAYGRVNRYVDEVVDVVVRDSSGSTVHTFTAGSQATATAVVHSHITGNRYSDGASGLGNPSTVKKLLDLVYTSFGADDFKVLVNGSGMLLQDAVAGLSGMFYNVKAPAYGADGDGVTDDTSAIAAAITAATSGGGNVFLPPGTYRITSQLSLPKNVNLIGCGPESTAIAIDHGSNYTLEVTGTGTLGQNLVSGIRFRALQANSTYCLIVGGTQRVIADNCHFGDGTNNDGDLTFKSTGAGVMKFRDCYFYVGSTSGKAISGASATSSVGGVWAENCVFVLPAGSYATTLVSAGNLRIKGCLFDLTANTGGTFNVIDSLQTDGYVIGCEFSNPTAGTPTAITNGNTTGTFIESGNSFGSGVTRYGTPGTGTIILGTREHAVSAQSINGTSVNLDTLTYGVHEITQTGGASFQFTCAGASTGVATVGSRLRLVYKNTTGGARTPTFDATYFDAATASACSDGDYETWEFIYSGSLWRQMGDQITF